MYPVEGSENLTLEKGAMPHPQTHDVTPYEELWEDLEVLVAGGEGPRGEDGKRVSSVLVMEDSLFQAKGMCIRVGGWMQGVMSVGGKVANLERWMWMRHTVRILCFLSFAL